MILMSSTLNLQSMKELKNEQLYFEAHLFYTFSKIGRYSGRPQPSFELRVSIAEALAKKTLSPRWF